MQFTSRNLTPEQLAAVQAAYDAGVRSYLGIAKAAGISRKAARALFKRAGIVSEAPQAPAPPRPRMEGFGHFTPPAHIEKPPAVTSGEGFEDWAARERAAAIARLGPAPTEPPA